MVFIFVILLFFYDPILSDVRSYWSNDQIIEFIKTETITQIENQRKIFLQNLAMIQNHNEDFENGLVPYRMAMNQFGHLDDEEFHNIYENKHAEDKGQMRFYTNYYRAPKNVTLPAAVDWRLKGAVAPIKSQNDCGSSYAFATIGSIESKYYIKYKKLVEFSKQQLVDCGSPPDLTGCKGGLDSMAYDYVQHIGLTKESEYPYEGVSGSCRLANLSIVVKLKAYKRIPPGSIFDMEAAVAFEGPVSIGVNIDSLKFVSGKEVLTGNWCRKPISHYVIVVGYNTTPKGQNYWIVKNSWGRGWGDQGYCLLERHKNDPCRLTAQAYVPYV